MLCSAGGVIACAYIRVAFWGLCQAGTEVIKCLSLSLLALAGELSVCKTKPVGASPWLTSWGLLIVVLND